MIAEILSTFADDVRRVPSIPGLRILTLGHNLTIWNLEKESWKKMVFTTCDEYSFAYDVERFPSILDYRHFDSMS